MADHCTALGSLCRGRRSVKRIAGDQTGSAIYDGCILTSEMARVACPVRKIPWHGHPSASTARQGFLRLPQGRHGDDRSSEPRRPRLGQDGQAALPTVPQLCGQVVAPPAPAAGALFRGAKQWSWWNLLLQQCLRNPELRYPNARAGRVLLAVYVSPTARAGRGRMVPSRRSRQTYCGSRLPPFLPRALRMRLGAV